MIGQTVDQAQFTRKHGRVSPQLGIYAESISTPATIDAPATYDPAQSRRQRFAMLREAAYILATPTYTKKNGLDGYERLTRCCRWTVRDARFIAVRQSGDSASFHNLERCESPLCPVCGVGRAETARNELAAAAAAAEQQGCITMLWTFTARHRAGTPLHELKARIGKAYSWFRSGRWSQRLDQEWGIVGTVRAKETTFGANGWHPHIHVLVILRADSEDRRLMDEQSVGLRETLAERWQLALSREGLEASHEIGVNVRVSDGYIAEYIAKFGREPLDHIWDVSDELARSQSKRTRRDGLTPMQLLAAAAGVNDDAIDVLRDISPDMKRASRAQLRNLARDLWAENYFAQKGDHMLRWSAGLKELLNVDAMVAALAAGEPEQEPVDRILIHVDTWAIICPSNTDHFVQADHRANLLQMSFLPDDELKNWLVGQGIEAIIIPKPDPT